MNKRETFPLFFRNMRRVPTRAELFMLRRHLTAMKSGLNHAISPYTYLDLLTNDAILTRYLIGDLNPDGESLWPVAFTTNVRIVHAKRVLKTISSKLHTILKDYS